MKYWLLAVLAIFLLPDAAHSDSWPDSFSRRVKVQNNCTAERKIYLDYKKRNGNWVVGGPWTIQPNKSVKLLDDGNKVFHRDGAQLYAHITDSGKKHLYYTKGTEKLMKNVNGRNLEFHEVQRFFLGDFVYIMICKSKMPSDL